MVDIEHKKLCKDNYEGSSGGMEVAEAQALCGRSEYKLGVRYTKCLGDGDSKGFMSVLESKAYGLELMVLNVSVTYRKDSALG